MEIISNINRDTQSRSSTCLTTEEINDMIKENTDVDLNLF